MKKSLKRNGSTKVFWKETLPQDRRYTVLFQKLRGCTLADKKLVQFLRMQDLPSRRFKGKWLIEDTEDLRKVKLLYERALDMNLEVQRVKKPGSPMPCYVPNDSVLTDSQPSILYVFYNSEDEANPPDRQRDYHDYIYSEDAEEDGSNYHTDDDEKCESLARMKARRGQKQNIDVKRLVFMAKERRIKVLLVDQDLRTTIIDHFNLPISRSDPKNTTYEEIVRRMEEEARILSKIDSKERRKTETPRYERMAKRFKPSPQNGTVVLGSCPLNDDIDNDSSMESGPAIYDESVWDPTIDYAAFNPWRFRVYEIN